MKLPTAMASDSARASAGRSVVHWTDVLAFWFAPPESPERGRPRDIWFRKSGEFDALVRERFGATREAAARGEIDGWIAAPLSALALVVVLDQFPRNIFRGHPQAFASDDAALRAARAIVAAGFDACLRPVERWFVYLPFEHAESLEAQRESLRLFDALRTDPASASAVEYAFRHYAVIARFGRFPHRNALLGRASTPEEAAFLAGPRSSF